MKTYQVSGIERGDQPPPILLASFATGDEAQDSLAADQMARMLLDNGATQVQIVIVDGQDRRQGVLQCTACGHWRWYHEEGTAACLFHAGKPDACGCKQYQSPLLKGSTMTSYPTSLPTDSLSVVIAAARAVATGQIGTIDKAHAAHACWDLSGYGLGLGLPDPTVTATAEPDFGALADSLEALQGGKKAALSWGQIISAIIQLLITLLGGAATP